jgi:hypothetical protein
MGALDASPSGRYVVVRIDGTLTLFQTEPEPGARLLPGSNELIRSITWSRDERLAALATQDAITFFPAETGRPSVRLPVSAARLQWR